MAPEQVRGRRGDARTDLYAAGSILYEMLTGHLPHDGPNAAALLHAKTHREPTPPRAYSRDIQPALEAIILKALARNPRDRYATAEEMLADLQEPLAFASTSGLEQGVPRGARGREQMPG
jgi:serine/threonine-protein kinase